MIVADGVVSTGAMMTVAGAPVSNLDGAEIFIFEDGELSGFSITLESQAGATITIAVDDYQIDPNTFTGADDPMMAIDLDSLPGWGAAAVTRITIADDNTPVANPGLTNCASPIAGDTSLEVDAVVARADVLVPLAPEASISVELSNNGVDADTAPGPTVPVGDPVTWIFEVLNTGDVPLIDIELNLAGVPIDCGAGTAIVPGPVAPNASFLCVATTTAQLGQVERVAQVRGTPADETGVSLGLPRVNDRDRSNYLGDSYPGSPEAPGAVIAPSLNPVSGSAGFTDPPSTGPLVGGVAVIAVSLAAAIIARRRSSALRR